MCCHVESLKTCIRIIYMLHVCLALLKLYNLSTYKRFLILLVAASKGWLYQILLKVPYRGAFTLFEI